MKKVIKKGAQAYVLHCYSMQREESEINIPKEIYKILGKYNTIFQDLP